LVKNKNINKQLKADNEIVDSISDFDSNDEQVEYEVNNLEEDKNKIQGKPKE
jgi:hypothetical protein